MLVGMGMNAMADMEEMGELEKATGGLEQAAGALEQAARGIEQAVAGMMGGSQGYLPRNWCSFAERDTADLALAVVASEEEKFDEAEKLCRRVLGNDGRNVSAYTQLAELHITRNEISDALRVLKVARDLQPTEPFASLVNSLQQFTELLLKLERGPNTQRQRADRLLITHEH
jgi:predicted Zn-dependent protease